MGVLSSGKTMEVYFEKAIDTYNEQSQLLPLVTMWEPNGGEMQNAGNTVWRNVEQQSPIIKGFDMTGLDTGIIEETCPFNLGTPNNDIYTQRLDDLRTRTFWENRGKATGKRQAAEVNKDISRSIINGGSLYFDSNAVSGFDVLGEAQAMQNERQSYSMDRYSVLNDRDTLKYAKDLASRATVKGRPETDAWSKGQIGENVAEYDVYTGSYLGNLLGNDGGADSTTTALLSFKPEGGTVNAAIDTVTNVDYRTADIPVVSSAGYAVGDYVKFSNAGADVLAVGLADKTITSSPMTFKVVATAAGLITVFPKPIAIDDPALSALEQAYGNIDTQITSGADVVKLNTYVGNRRTNIFWGKDSIEVVGGTLPAEIMNEFGGMKQISETLENGLEAYLFYDANIFTLGATVRFFVWYGVTNAIPSDNGVFTTF